MWPASLLALFAVFTGFPLSCVLDGVKISRNTEMPKCFPRHELLVLRLNWAVFWAKEKLLLPLLRSPAARSSSHVATNFVWAPAISLTSLLLCRQAPVTTGQNMQKERGRVAVGTSRHEPGDIPFQHGTLEASSSTFAQRSKDNPCQDLRMTMKQSRASESGLISETKSNDFMCLIPAICSAAARCLAKTRRKTPLNLRTNSPTVIS